MSKRTRPKYPEEQPGADWPIYSWPKGVKGKPKKKGSNRSVYTRDEARRRAACNDKRKEG